MMPTVAGVRDPENGDRHLLPERPFGCFAQKEPVPFLRLSLVFS